MPVSWMLGVAVGSGSFLFTVGLEWSWCEIRSLASGPLPFRLWALSGWLAATFLPSFEMDSISEWRTALYYTVWLFRLNILWHGPKRFWTMCVSMWASHLASGPIVSGAQVCSPAQIGYQWNVLPFHSVACTSLRDKIAIIDILLFHT